MEAAALPVDTGILRRRAAPPSCCACAATNSSSRCSMPATKRRSVICDRFGPGSWRMCAACSPGPRANAEDVLQNVYMRAYGALRADDRPVAVRAWLYRVAHDRCIDELRRPGAQPTEIVEQEGDSAP